MVKARNEIEQSNELGGDLLTMLPSSQLLANVCTTSPG